MILFIDDEVINQRLIRDILKKYEYEVMTVSGGQEAIKAVTDYGPQIELFIIDYHLADTNGIELLRELRSLGAKSPAIAFTGSVEKSEHQKFLDNGFDAVLVKSFFRIEPLIELISKYCKR